MRGALSACSRGLMLLGVAGVLSACSGGSPSPAPTDDSGTLTFGTLERLECLTSPPGTDLLLGDIIGPSSARVTLENVDTSDSFGLDVIAVYLLDPTLGTPYGTWASLPEGEAIWDERELAEGATLEVGEIANIVVHAVVGPEQDAEVPPLIVRYRVGEDEREVRGLTTFRVSTTCD